MITLDLTQKEIDFLKRVWNVEDPTSLIKNLVRQHLEQLVNQEFKFISKTTEEKINVIEATLESEKSKLQLE